MGETPEGTIEVSISTPHGSGDTTQSELQTVPSVSIATERDLGRDIDSLADEIRTYDQDIADNVRALRDELRDLAQFLHRTPSPPVVVTAPPVVVAPIPPAPVAEPAQPPVERTERSVGGSDEVSVLYPGDPRDMGLDVPAQQAALSRSSSNASSLASYLSSHHSDDYIFEEGEEPEEESIVSPAIWQSSIESSSSPDESDESESLSSSSPLSESSDAVTVQPPPVDDTLDRSLREIQDQLQALRDGQATARDLLEALRQREIPVPEDHTAELANRLQRIEDLIRALSEQGHPRGPPVPEVPPEEPASARTESISESTDSLGRLRDILENLARPDEEPHMPAPVTAEPGPSMAQRLDDILRAADNLTPVGSIEPPRVVPFIYQPAERGPRPRSASPDISLPRSRTVPPPFTAVPSHWIPLQPRRQAARPPGPPGPEPSESESSSHYSAPQPPRPPTQFQDIPAQPTPVPPPQPARPVRTRPTPRPIVCLPVVSYYLRY